LNGFLSVDCAISLIYALLPMARRQREWQATSDQGLDELIGSPVPKMRLTPTIAISPLETEGPQLDRGSTGQLAAMFALRISAIRHGQNRYLVITIAGNSSSLQAIGQNAGGAPRAGRTSVT
jgi:hypothetical protein